MAELFLEVLNRSISASWLVLIIIAVRFLLNKAPKWMDVVLWGLVAMRLVCPFSLESTLSLIPSTETVPPEILLSPMPQIYSGVDAINNTVNPILAEKFSPEPVASANPLQILIPILAFVWCVGMAGMALYTFVSYLRLRWKVRTAIHVSEELYLSEFVSTPFVLGLFRPRIYLPYHMPEQDNRYVIDHERTHICRKDHWWKPLGFLLLAVNWFNPLMWLAYILLCRDIELACDEKVIRDMGPGQRADYSQALLNCSVTRRTIAACPLAFGEVGVKERIVNVLSYRKPTFWIVLAAVLICAVVAVCFLTDPATPEKLKWLQTLKASDILRIEYHCPSAEPGKQYALYEGDALSSAADIFNSFDGDRVRTVDVSPTDRIRYTLTVTTVDLQVHTVENIGDVYLCIDGSYFEDTDHLLDSKWNLSFQGTDYLPAAEDSSLDVEMTVEECSPTGATVLFRQFSTGEDTSLFGGNDYFLQRLTDGSWEDLPMQESPTFTTGTYSLSTIRRQKIEWEWLYGVLPEGHYRIGKSVTRLQDSGQSSVVYGEFTLAASENLSQESEDMITDFPVNDSVCIGIIPTELGHSRYAVLPDQEAAIAAFQTAIAAASPNSGWRNGDRPTGITVQYQGEYLYPLESGEMVSFNGRVSATDATEMYAICADAARQAGWQSAVWPEQIHGIQSATLSWYDTVTLSDPQKLSQLETMLSRSTVLYGGAGCPFGNLLTLELEDGETITISIADDSCGAWLSNGVYFRFGSGNEGLYRLFSPEIISMMAKESMDSLLNVLAYLDWSGYANTYGPEETLALMDLLRNWAMEDPSLSRIQTILFLTTGLDGAYTEAFANILGELYECNPEDFSWACLGNATKETAAVILDLLSRNMGLSVNETRALLQSNLS